MSAYIKIPGVNGNARGKHAGWIEVRQWSIVTPVNELRFTKRSDDVTLTLMRYLHEQTVIKVFDLVDENQRREFKFVKARIAHLTISGKGADSAALEVKVGFEGVTVAAA